MDRRCYKVPYIRKDLDCVAFAISKDRVVYLWIRTRGKANRAVVVVEYIISCPDRMMTLMNYSTEN